MDTHGSLWPNAYHIEGISSIANKIKHIGQPGRKGFLDLMPIADRLAAPALLLSSAR